MLIGCVFISSLLSPSLGFHEIIFVQMGKPAKNAAAPPNTSSNIKTTYLNHRILIHQLYYRQLTFFFRSTAVPCKLIPEIFMITHLVLFEHNRIKLQANVRAKKKNKHETQSSASSSSWSLIFFLLLFIKSISMFVSSLIAQNRLCELCLICIRTHSTHNRSISVVTCFCASLQVLFIFGRYSRTHARKKDLLHVAFVECVCAHKKRLKKYGHFVAFRVY